MSALHVIRASLAANVRAALTGPSGGPPGRRAYIAIGAIAGIRIEQVSKHFKDKEAVNDVSLTLSAGVWGLLGANGAGKTTLMHTIASKIGRASCRERV